MAKPPHLIVYEEPRSFVIDTPEKQLLWAILKRAIEDFLCPKRDIQRIAQFWLTSLENKNEGSLFWVLDNLCEDVEIGYKALQRLLFHSPELLSRVKSRTILHRVSSDIRRRKKSRNRLIIPV